MDTNESQLLEEALTREIIGVFYSVYNELGAGFLECVYENALVIALREAGLAVEQQVPLAVHFHDKCVGDFKVDLLVEERVVVELKAVSQLNPRHEVQLVNYLKATGRSVGLLLNFGPRAEFKRRVFSSRQLDRRSSASIRVEKDV